MCTTKSRFSSWSCGNVLATTTTCFSVAVFELELRKRISRTTPEIQSCDFRAGAAEVCFARHLTTKLRYSTAREPPGTIASTLNTDTFIDMSLAGRKSFLSSLIWVWVKISHHQTTGFSPWFHLPRFHFGYPVLTHSHMIPSGGGEEGGDAAFMEEEEQAIPPAAYMPLGRQNRIAEGHGTPKHNRHVVREPRI